LPGGSDLLTPLVWQPVPGADGAYIYLSIRKIDTISSNSYLIATPDVLILIDPGGLPEQAEELALVIGECRREQDRPVFVFLTHVHTDHFAGIFAVPAFVCPEIAVFVVQELGGEALERGDAKVTQAELQGRALPPLKIGLPLFPRSWQRSICIRLNGVRMSLFPGMLPPPQLQKNRRTWVSSPAFVSGPGERLPVRRMNACAGL
jgi:hypothetical protein